MEVNENIHKEQNSTRWGLELGNIVVLEKYAGTELYSKIMKFRQQINVKNQPEKVVQEENEPPKQPVSIEDFLANFAESKEMEEPVTPKPEPNILPEKEVSPPKVDDSFAKLLQEANNQDSIQPMEEETVPIEEDNAIAVGDGGDDDFDLYGDLGGGLLAAAVEEEEEEVVTKAPDPKTTDDDDLYGELFVETEAISAPKEV